VFVKYVKLLRLALTFSPTTGCVTGVGISPAPLCKTLAYNPEADKAIFIYAILRFALIEIFVFMLFGAARLILVY
jgi:F0F1-type ATP synthase membrane subunit c/vacuolar-type H+-ATPase subunit K